MTQIITNGFGVPNRTLTNGLGADNVILHYISEQNIKTSCLSDIYIESRECIFGSKSEIFWKPLIKALMMICDYKKAKYHVEDNEYFIDKVEGLFKGQLGRYWFIEIASALMARVTNYYQSLYGYYDEELPSQIKDDISKLIHEFIYRNMKDVIVYIDLSLLENKYGIGLSICKL